MFPFRSSFVRLPKNQKFNYQPRHYDPDKEKREEAKKGIKLERGSFYKANQSQIRGAFSERNLALRERLTIGKRIFRLVFLAGILAWTYLIYSDRINFYLGIVLLLLFLVIFLREVNKY